MEMKKTKTLRMRAALPTDVVVKIALFVYDPATQFSLLEALHGSGLLGSFGHLYELGKLCDHDKLWPRLVIKERPSPTCRLHLEAIMAYYKHVEISAIFDLDWLSRFVHCEACVFYNGLPFQMLDVEDVKSWYSQWTTSLRISRLTTGQFVTADFVSILPQLQHLEALHYNAMTIDLAVIAAIFEMANLLRVAQPVELDLNNESSDEVWIDATLLPNAIAWLTTSPVRRFRILSWYWDPDVADDSTLIQAFYSALFNCPTLDSLDINDCELSAAAFEGATLSMRELVLTSCQMDEICLDSVSQRLATSDCRVMALSIENNDTLGMERIFDILPATRIRKLVWNGSHLDNEICSILAPLIQQSKLEWLELRNCSITDVGADHLARQMRHNQSLRVLDLRDNNIGLTGAMTLLEHASHVGRLVKVEAIRIVGAVEEETIDDKLIAFWHKTLSKP
ncbi:hypothetical protein AC1031_008094 [Aphanomyces cochlioides]|nr:hypothetical protein AC1031_008094 [Aphanomyces cochlioides]